MTTTARSRCWAVNRPALIALLVLAATLAAAPAPLSLSETDDGKTINLKIGQDARLALTASAGTGYRWELDPVNAKVVKVGELQIEADLTPGLVGGPVKFTWPLTAVGAGSVTLLAKLVRPWMPQEPAKTMTIRVDVK
jgi:predicted secreted protein